MSISYFLPSLVHLEFAANLQELAMEENRNRQQEVEILQLKSERDNAMYVGRLMEVKINQALYQAKLQQKKNSSKSYHKVIHVSIGYVRFLNAKPFA